jgi:uncharacterized protein
MSGLPLRRALSYALVVALAITAVVLGWSRHAPAAVPAVPVTSSDRVAVSGTGSSNGAPDTLNVDFRVHVTRSTVQDAIDAQAAAARRVLAALDRAGVPAKRVRTTDLNLDEHYDNSGVVVGYDASETLRARISPLRIAGRTIGSVATAAGNDVTVGGLSFDIADDDALVTSARSEAYDAARAKAEQYAGLAGRKLGRVLSIREHVERATPTPYPYADAFLAKTAAGAGVPIRGGRQSLTVSVAVVWSLG